MAVQDVPEVILGVASDVDSETVNFTVKYISAGRSSNGMESKTNAKSQNSHQTALRNTSFETNLAPEQSRAFGRSSKNQVVHINLRVTA